MHEIFILPMKLSAVLLVGVLATLLAMGAHSLAAPPGTLAATASLPLFWTGGK